MLTCNRTRRHALSVILLIAVLLTLLPVLPAYAAPELIADLVVFDSDTAGDWSVRSNLQVGEPVYGDREYLLTALPAGMEGMDWIRAANSIKNYAGDPWLSFTITEDAYVYVMYTDEIVEPSAWLAEQGWYNTYLTVTSEANTYLVYRKKIEGGTELTLGNNGVDMDKSAYWIAAAPVDAPQPGLITDFEVFIEFENSNTGGNIKDEWLHKIDIQVGDLLYSDRDFLIDYLPPNMAGVEWLQAANSAKRYEGAQTDPWLQFTVAADSIVYVCEDTKIGDLPAWMGDFEKTTESFSAFTGEATDFKIYRKVALAGETLTFGHYGGDDNCIYTILVTPLNAPQIGEDRIPDPDNPPLGPGYAPLTVTINGAAFTGNEAVSAPIQFGRVPMLPIGAVAELFGYTVEWSDVIGVQKITGGGRTVFVTTGAPEVGTIDGTDYPLRVLSREMPDGLLVDFGFVCDALGLRGVYDYAKGTLTIDQGLAYDSLPLTISGSVVDPAGELPPEADELQDIETKELWTIDGAINEEERWVGVGDEAWIAYDLGASTNIGAVQIAWYAGDARNWVFEIEVSADANAWTKVFSGISGGISNELETFQIPETGARYIRYLGHGNTGGSVYNSVTQFAVLGGEGTPIPLPEAEVPATPVPTAAPPAATQTPAPAAQETASTPVGLIVGIIAGALVLIVIIVILVRRGKAKK